MLRISRCKLIASGIWSQPSRGRRTRARYHCRRLGPCLLHFHRSSFLLPSDIQLQISKAVCAMECSRLRFRPANEAGRLGDVANFRARLNLDAQVLQIINSLRSCVVGRPYVFEYSCCTVVCHKLALGSSFKPPILLCGKN